MVGKGIVLNVYESCSIVIIIIDVEKVLLPSCGWFGFGFSNNSGGTSMYCDVFFRISLFCLQCSAFHDNDCMDYLFSTTSHMLLTSF